MYALDLFEAKPYRLFNKIQHYDWGTKNENAFIPKFLNIEAQKNIPYAELWIGAHPKASSEIEIAGVRKPLNEVVEKCTLECLGEIVSKKFDGRFPFLFKVLSAANALSIQTHPDKSQAEKLHRSDPKNYPDSNHKPEIAIAIDSLTAVAGFRPVKEITDNLRSLVELKKFAGEETIVKILTAENNVDASSYIKELYGIIMNMAEDKENLTTCINSIRERLKLKELLSSEEEQFLNEYELFGADVGLLSFFFFNIIQLKPKQAIFTDAGVPHAYIKGNIIECMANSDNVVRAGLTNKFKDVKTLLGIIKYDFNKYEVITSTDEKDEAVYKTKAEEFEVRYFNKKSKFRKTIKTESKPSVYLIADGNLEVNWFSGENLTERYSKGESFLVPASLAGYEISSGSKAEFFQVVVP